MQNPGPAGGMLGLKCDGERIPFQSAEDSTNQVPKCWSSDVYEKCLVHLHDANRPQAHKADMKKSGSEMSISGEDATFNIVIYAYLPGFYSHNLFERYKSHGKFRNKKVPKHLRHCWTTLAPVPLYHWPNNYVRSSSC
jgi:hypothetical protein